VCNARLVTAVKRLIIINNFGLFAVRPHPTSIPDHDRPLLLQQIWSGGDCDDVTADVTWLRHWTIDCCFVIHCIRWTRKRAISVLRPQHIIVHRRKLLINSILADLVPVWCYWQQITDVNCRITSAEGRRICFCLCLSVCLSVRLSARFLKKLLRDFDAVFGRVQRNKRLSRFWWHSRSRIWIREFLKDFLFSVTNVWTDENKTWTPWRKFELCECNLV